jgi:hypothetical protein
VMVVTKRFWMMARSQIHAVKQCASYAAQIGNPSQKAFG